MKGKLSKLCRSGLALLLTAVMVFNMSANVFAAQATDGSSVDLDIDGDKVINYVTFGDSVTNGYGMEGYRYDDGTNVLGFRREVAGSYPVVISEYLEEQGYTVNLEQLAISGFRMDELHWMLCDDYEPDYYHTDNFYSWNRRAFNNLRHSSDEEAKADFDYLYNKYKNQYTADEMCSNDIRDEKGNSNADRIIMAEYREAVDNADLITIDLGTNNFGTFLTSTISSILTGDGVSKENVDKKTNFANYLDAKSAATLGGIIDQMACQMAGLNTPNYTNMGFALTRTLARCMLYGYLGFTEHYDGALDALYEINPDVNVVVIDMYTMISGVQLEGEALGDVDLDAIYNLFINMANFYANELSPYAQKVTHVSLEKDPALLIDDYKEYVYPDNQGILVESLNSEDYNSTAVTLLNEFIMEARGLDPDNPEHRDKFQTDVVDNIQLLDSYVYHLQDTIQTMVVEDQILPGINDNIKPIELAMDAIDLIYMAVSGVASAEDGVDASIEGVAAARDAIQTAKDGVKAAKDAVDMINSGVDTAEKAVDTAVDGVAAAQSLVGIIVEKVLGNSMFSTSSGMKSFIISAIKSVISDMDLTEYGFDNSEETVNKLAEEIYVIACIYYNEEKSEGGSTESANRLAIIEVIRYKLVETEGYSEEEAQTTAELAYEIDKIYKTEGKDAAIIAAMETEITDDMMNMLGADSKVEAAEFAYKVSKMSEKEAIIAVMETQITDELMATLGAETQKEAAEFAYYLATATEKDAVVAAIETQITPDLMEKTGAETEKEAAEFVYYLNSVYEETLAETKDKDEAHKAAVIAAVESQLPADAIASVGLTAEEAAVLAYDVAESYNAMKANGADEETAVVTCLIAVAKEMGMTINEATAKTGYQLYVNVYAPAIKAGADKATAKKNTVIYALKTEFVNSVKMNEATAEAVATAMYAVYKEEATAEQQQVAYIAAMQIAGIPEAVATAIYTCYVTDLDGYYKDENVKTTMLFFIARALNATDEKAAESYDAYLSYKNVAEALGKISRLDTIYFDSLLAASLGGGIDVDAIGDKIVNGTLLLEMPVQGVEADGTKFEESSEDYEKRVQQFYAESSLAIFYFRFMAADGVFTHPSVKGHTSFVEEILNGFNNMVPDTKADEDIIITEETSILSIGDAVVDSDNENNYTELIASKLGVTDVNYVQSDFARLEDFYNALVNETGDAFAQTVVAAKGGIDSSLEEKIINNDIIVVNLGSMNLGYSAMQLAKYMGNGSTYPMTFADKENMSVRQLGATVDGFLVSFQKMLGVLDSEGNRVQSDATPAGTIMLLLESYGYGITTFTNDFNKLMDKIHELNPNATIVLTGVGDIAGDAYYAPEDGSAYLALGDFYQHGAALLNGHMEKYAAQTSNVFYIDTMDAENPANLNETAINIASDDVGSILNDAHFTDNGHATIAAKVNCTDLGVHFMYDTSTAATCTIPGTITQACKTCEEAVNGTTSALGHSYGEQTVQTPATCTTSGVDIKTCTVCEEGTEGHVVEIPTEALGHKYDTANKVWTWNDEWTEATVTFACTVCEEGTEGHEVSVKAEIETTIPDPQCVETGTATYKAVATFGDIEYTDVKTKDVAAIGHTYDEPTWSWNAEYTEATATFKCTYGDCTHIEDKKASGDAIATEVKEEATCVKAGKKELAATVTLNGKTYTSPVEEIVIPATGIHKYEDGECTMCGDIENKVDCEYREETTLKAGELVLVLGGTEVGTYTFEEVSGGWAIKGINGYLALADGTLTTSSTPFAWTYADGMFSATETVEEESSSDSWLGNIFGGIFGGIFGSGSTTTTTTTYYLVASGSAAAVSTSTTGATATFYEKHNDGNADHNYVKTVVEATCTTDGYTEYKCSKCGTSYKKDEVKAFGHDYSAKVVAPTCTTPGYTEYTCQNDCGDTYTSDETPATGHSFVDGLCEHCGEEEAKEPECVGTKEVTLTSGLTATLTLGGTNVGTFTFTQADGGWTIRTQDGTYLAGDGSSLTYSNEAFVWTYSNNRFSYTVTTESSSSSGSWLSKLFGGIFGGSSTTTTTYYLVDANGTPAVSTSTSYAAAAFLVESIGDHVYGEPVSKDGMHVYTCTVCGNTKSEACTDEDCTLCNPGETPDEPEDTEVKINVSVSITKTEEEEESDSWFSKLFGGLFGGSSSTKTTYTATINATAEGTEVSKVEYSTDGSNWKEGTSFTSESNITKFYIRVTDEEGTVHNFAYADGIVTENAAGEETPDTSVEPEEDDDSSNSSWWENIFGRWFN